MDKNRLSKLFPNIVFWIVKCLLSLRYRIEVIGLEKLTPDRLARSGGIVFLPNHPAEIDPVILVMILGKKFFPRPLVVEQFFYMKGIQIFMKIVRALPLPSMDGTISQWRGKKIQKQLQQIVSELRKKENFLIYPAGRLKMSGLEMIGGASFVHDLLTACPEANVVLVRTTGLWGSQFSRALTGSSPEFGKTLWNCFKILLKNGIFFTPRRTVTVKLELASRDFPFKESRLTLNKYLEKWYNRYPEIGPEPLKLVSFAWGRESIPQPAIQDGLLPSKDIELKSIPEKVQNDVCEELSRLTKRPADQIDRKMHLSHDLGIDSLDTVQIYVYLSEKYAIDDLLPGDLQTVEDVMQSAAGYKKERESDREQKTFYFSWPDEPNRPDPNFSQGVTIHEAFLLCCDRMKGCAASVDAIGGLMSYDRLKMGSVIVAEKLRQIPGDYIGIMLPASSGTYIVILAVLLSGKVPIMLNWTTGVKALNYAAELTGLQTVISSDRFLDRLENVDLGQIEEKLVLMENLRKSISWLDKIKGFLFSHKRASRMMRAWDLDRIKPDSTAVILFTSGTEALPKGVPLSHRNLLHNQRAALSCIDTNASDIFYGVLPPFHSFGFSVTGLLPLLAGIRAGFAPDPTDSHGMAHDVRTWKATLFCCAPSFFRALFHVAKIEELQTLRYVVTGAEKTPDEIFAYVAQHIPHAHCLEGYGITECGPIVTLTRPNEPRIGVGKPLPGVELIVIDDEQRPLPKGQEGEICIRGPSVFEKYLGNPREPFLMIEGKKWYLSGDRGSIDEEGNLIFSGRLKRFVKIGGEMVSLGGLEGELLQLAEEKKWVTASCDGPPLAVSVRERGSDKPLIILYTVFPISTEVVNNALKDSGLGRLVRVSEVKHVPQIPLTGTGKTHYRLLDETVS